MFYRLGFIGASKTATCLANYFRSFSNIEIVGFYSLNLDSSIESATIVDSKFFDDPTAILVGSDIIFVGVNDDNIGRVATELVSNYKQHVRQQLFCHFSGAVASTVLKDSGLVNCASMHPIFSFPSKQQFNPNSLKECKFTLEGDSLDLLINLLEYTKNQHYTITADYKRNYHLACVLASSGILGMIAWANRLLSTINHQGIDLSNLSMEVINNLLKHKNIGAVITGPLARGDSQIMKDYFTLLDDNEQTSFAHLMSVLLPHTRLSDIKVQEFYNIFNLEDKMRENNPFSTKTNEQRGISTETNSLAVDGINEQTSIKVKKPFSINDFNCNNKISMVTAYDYHSARLVEESGINAILVGDSLGMVIQGNANTISVTKEDMIYHAKLVRRGAPNTFIVVDMPYMSYHNTIAQTVENGGEIIKTTGTNALKLEVNSISSIQHVQALIDAQIPVMGHIGLTGQSINIFGGFKVQGKNDETAKKIINLAKRLEEVGCFAIVLECMPAGLATTITGMLNIPTIGIGSGVDCNEQILVLHDLLGIHAGHTPRFVKQYLNGNELINIALRNYVEEVQDCSFPQQVHCFKG